MTAQATVSKDQIVSMLKTNDKAIGRALVALTVRQTADEQRQGATKYANGMGFRPAHARMGTSMGEFFKTRGFLSPKQVAYWRKPMKDGKMRIEIYAGQLSIVAQEKAAMKEKAGSHALPSFETKEQAFDWMYKILEDVGEHCVDNDRFAFSNDPQAMNVYDEA